MPTSEMTNRAERSHHDGEGARALVLVVTGTSGAGKGTLEKILLERMPEVELAVSATTREQRAGEQNGREYWFITPEKFEQLSALLREYDAPMEGRAEVWVEITRPDAITDLVAFSDETDGQFSASYALRSPGVFSMRIRARGETMHERATESSGEIQVRLDLARKQQTLKSRFDHAIVNDDVERAARELTELVRRELQTAGTMSRP